MQQVFKKYVNFKELYVGGSVKPDYDKELRF